MLHRKLLVLIGCMGLAACGAHSNSLLQQPTHMVAKWLYKAELSAMELLHFYDTNGSVYLACMRNSHQFDNPVTQQTGR